MKKKLTTLLFGLLLAVGWTSNASAQSAEPNGATYKESVVKNWTYTWTDAAGAEHTSSFTDVADDPYQMYELVRQVYMDKRFPGPYYTGYADDGTTRERKVYYGSIEGGWDINGAQTSAVDDITITFASYSVLFNAITVTGNNLEEPLTWTYANNGLTLPSGWSGNLNQEDDTYNGTSVGGSGTAGTITIPSSLLNGSTQVTVSIQCRRYSSNSETYNCYVTINGTRHLVSGLNYSAYTWTVNGTTHNDENYYKPNEEGYTALMVSLNNTITHAEKHYPENDSYNYDNYFTTKNEIINYLTNNVQSIRLLTDGLRIGSTSDYTRGTVFNCDGVYNKFFILSKGQSRQKDQAVLARQNQYGYLLGERVLFKELFEEFSPTDGSSGSEITDFYSRMTEGSVYEVLHDCASVIENEHEFSMSGKAGTTAFSMSGLNFFIPDYRLKYWETTYDYKYTDWWGTQHTETYTVDGRTMNPYKRTDGTTFTDASNFCSNYAQYNQDIRPKMGIYLIHLEATAEQVADSHEEGNQNYKVTLTWTSSLNEMAKKDVPQTYTVYYYDDNGNLQWVVAEGITDGETHQTTISYLVEQREHSYAINYIIKGRPDDSDHASFIAWSNTDGVIIPGWNDFVGLDLDHFESDFVTTDLQNWYRNFLLVKNDVGDGLTTSKISDGMNSFNVYRYDAAKADAKIQIATLTFSNPTDEQVNYKVEYVDDLQNIKEDKYNRSAMQIPDEGIVRVKGNGDIVIQPNGYWVNFKSIVVKNNNQTIASWTGGDLPRTMKISDGSEWEEYTTDAGDNVHYIEGGGYIYIPSMLNRYSNLTVEIVAYADGSNTAKITVNDLTQSVSNTATTTAKTWSNLSDNGAGLLRLALPIVDQFNVDIPSDNKHPNRYGYVLMYEPSGADAKESGSVEVPVLHTEVAVNGYYTEEQVMDDKDRSLAVDMMSADVTLNLPVAANPTPEYVRLQGGLNVIPEPEKNMLSQLFRRTAGDYREEDKTSPLYVADDTYAYPAGKLEYFNKDDITTGEYTKNYISYAPSITADGIARRYYEDDHLDNSYGGPIWVSSVGMVDVSGNVEQASDSKWSTWTYNEGENDVKCTFFRAALNLDGYLPLINVPKLSNPEYEPFMFRVWVKCDNMRNYKYDNTSGRYVDDGPVGSNIQLLQDEEIYWPTTATLEGNKCSLTYGSIGDTGNGPDAYNNNLVFGAPVGSKPTYIVRFYYRAKKASNTTTLRANGEEVPMYYVVEGEFTPDEIPTAVSELVVKGDVVSKTYINAIGQQSDKPFKGVNIVITRYSDGTVTTTKVVK